MKIEKGQRYDFEIYRDDLSSAGKSIIATWFNNGNPVSVELAMNKSLLEELIRFFNRTSKKSALVSIERTSKSKYIISPTVVVVNKPRQTP